MRARGLRVAWELLLLRVVQRHRGERGGWLRWRVEVVPVDRTVHHLVSVVPVFVSVVPIIVSMVPIIVSVVSFLVSVVPGRLVLSEIVSVCQRGVSVR